MYQTGRQVSIFFKGGSLIRSNHLTDPPSPVARITASVGTIPERNTCIRKSLIGFDALSSASPAHCIKTPKRCVMDGHATCDIFRQVPMDQSENPLNYCQLSVCVCVCVIIPTGYEPGHQLGRQVIVTRICSRPFEEGRASKLMLASQFMTLAMSSTAGACF